MVLLRIGRNECPGVGELYEWSLGDDGIMVDEALYDSVGRARQRLLEESHKRTVYGFHTRLGKLFDTSRLSSRKYEEKVLHEHAVGVGDYMPPTIGRLFAAIRIVQATRGYTPVTPSTLSRIVDALNCGLAPAIPARGSVGASGDLAPASHAMEELFLGRGKVWRDGSLVDAAKALSDCGLAPRRLERGEALLLINTTAYSTALLVFSIGLLRELLDEVYANTARIGRVLGWNCEHFSTSISEAKKHPGIRKVISVLGGRCSGSPRRLQDPYSIRCTPNLLGSVVDTLDYAERIAHWEICSPSSNPIVTREGVVHQCGFHAVYPSLAMDYLAIASTLVSNMIEERSSRILDDAYTGLPRFLAGSKSSVGGMIIHYTIASLAAELRALASPRSVHNIPTSLGHEDIVSMAPNSGLRLIEMLKLLIDQVYLERALAVIAEEASSGREINVEEAYEEALRESRDFKVRRGF